MNNTLLRSLLFGFLPLLVFVIAETLWGLLIGLYAAGIVSVIELVRYYIQDKKINSILLFDFSLILIFGLLSFQYEDPLFIKLKPAFMNGILIVFLIVFKMKPVFLNQYFKRFNMELTEEKLAKILPLFDQMIIITLLHTALDIYSAYALNDGYYIFISGPLFYILMAFVFISNIYIYILDFFNILL